MLPEAGEQPMPSSAWFSFVGARTCVPTHSGTQGNTAVPVKSTAGSHDAAAAECSDAAAADDGTPCAYFVHLCLPQS